MNKPDTREIQTKTENYTNQATDIIISGPNNYELATIFLKDIVKLKKEVVDTFRDPKTKAWEAHKAIVAAEKKHKDPLDKAERIVKMKIGEYVQEQERVAREKRLKLEAEQRKKDEEARLREAEALEDAGQTEEAEAVLEEPTQAVHVPVQPAVEKQEGVSYREDWDFEIVDPTKIPRSYMIINEKVIRSTVKALKGETNIPGVKVFSKKTVAVR